MTTIISTSSDYAGVDKTKIAPKVTIIILNWNGLDVTTECLKSLSEVQYDNFNVVVVDNGSTVDPTEFLNKEFPDVSVLRLKENFGFTGGNNVGMEWALKQSADYVLLLNNDTIVDKQFLSELVHVAEADLTIGALNPKIYYYDFPDRLWFAGGTFSYYSGEVHHLGRKEYDHGQYDKTTEMSFVNGCAFFVRASVLKEVGLLDDRLFIYSEDLDLTLRIMKRGYRCKYVPKSIIWHKEGIDTLRNKSQSFRFHLAVRNILIVMRTNAQWYHYFLFVPNFIVQYILRYVVVSVIHRDYKGAKAVMLGVRDFFAGKYGKI